LDIAALLSSCLSMKMPLGFNTTLLTIKSGISWQVGIKSIARWMTDFHFSYILLKKSKESYQTRKVTLGIAKSMKPLQLRGF
jgi:hypothetical protein